MSKLIDDGGPAFPLTWEDKERRTTRVAQGMTLRDHFAGLAMPLAMNRLRKNYTKDLDNDWHWDEDDWAAIAEHSYAMADAMLKAREA